MKIEICKGKRHFEKGCITLRTRFCRKASNVSAIFARHLRNLIFFLVAEELSRPGKKTVQKNKWKIEKIILNALQYA